MFSALATAMPSADPASSRAASSRRLPRRASSSEQLDRRGAARRRCRSAPSAQPLPDDHVLAGVLLQTAARTAGAQPPAGVHGHVPDLPAPAAAAAEDRAVERDARSRCRPRRRCSRKRRAVLAGRAARPAPPGSPRCRRRSAGRRAPRDGAAARRRRRCASRGWAPAATARRRRRPDPGSATVAATTRRPSAAAAAERRRRECGECGQRPRSGERPRWSPTATSRWRDVPSRSTTHAAT